MKAVQKDELVAKHERRAKKEAQHREARRAKFATVVEVARATRASSIIGVGYVDGTSHYSLASNGLVYQGMTFRWDTTRTDSKSGYASSTWNVTRGAEKMSIEQFAAHYGALGFEVKVYDKPKRINYDKQLRQLHESEEESPELQLKVLELFAGGAKMKAISDELGLEWQRVRRILRDI